MLKETDMNGVRKTARLFLMLEPVPTKLSPMVVKHPFTDSGFVMTRGDGDNPVKMVNIMEDQKALHQWREEKAEQIRALKEPNELFAMLTKSYYMVFLKYAMPYLSQKDFSEYLGTAWICDENPNSDPNFTTRKLVGLFKKADPEALMTPEERQQLQALPDSVTVYRGVTSFNAKRIKVLSWTLDKDTAQWFANRFGEKGTVYTAQIHKEHICALFHGRNESEIILDPKYLMDITPDQQPRSGMEMKM